MTVGELIEKLSSLESDAQVLVRFMNSDAYGSFKDLEDFDERDIEVKPKTVILDISNK